MRYRPFLLAFALTTSSWLLAAEKNTVTLEGTLVSTVCYLGNPAKPMTNDMGSKKKCGTHCLQRGTPGGLVTKENKLYILTASSLRLAPYVGQQIRVTGDEYGDIVHVESVDVQKGESWQPVMTAPRVSGK